MLKREMVNHIINFIYHIHQLILVQIENNAFKIRFTSLAIQVYYLHFQGM